MRKASLLLFLFVESSTFPKRSRPVRVGGIAVGALGMALVSRGKLNIKPLATDLLASGIDLRDKALAAVDGVKEDLADVVAEAQVKQQEKKATEVFVPRPLMLQESGCSERYCFNVSVYSCSGDA